MSSRYLICSIRMAAICLMTTLFIVPLASARTHTVVEKNFGLVFSIKDYAPQKQFEIKTFSENWSENGRQEIVQPDNNLDSLQSNNNLNQEMDIPIDMDSLSNLMTEIFNQAMSGAGASLGGEYEEYGIDNSDGTSDVFRQSYVHGEPYGDPYYAYSYYWDTDGDGIPNEDDDDDDGNDDSPFQNWLERTFGGDWIIAETEGRGRPGQPLQITIVVTPGLMDEIMTKPTENKELLH